jgi:hypothetical protein
MPTMILPKVRLDLFESAQPGGPTTAPEGEGEGAGPLECRWQRDHLPERIRELGLMISASLARSGWSCPPGGPCAA